MWSEWSEKVLHFCMGPINVANTKDHIFVGQFHLDRI